MFLLSSEKVANTNPRCVIKTDIADNIEPTVSITLGKPLNAVFLFKFCSFFLWFFLLDEGKQLLFKTENLNSLEFLTEFNKIVLPLVPKEEEIKGVAGKIAAKAGKQINKKK